MEQRKQFWMEALKGGTIVGLVSVAFSIVTQVAPEQSFWVKALDFTSVVVTILLVAGYLRRFARLHTRTEGFSYGRGVGFVVAMMLFVGVITGIYSAVMANFFIKEELLGAVDMAMAQTQDMIPAESFDTTYNVMRASVTNPLFITISSVISNAFLGLIYGLILSITTRRQPDIFAPEENNNENQE